MATHRAGKAGLAWEKVLFCPWAHTFEHPLLLHPSSIWVRLLKASSQNPFKWSHCVHPCAYTTCVHAVFWWWQRWRAHANMSASVPMHFTSVRVFACTVRSVFVLTYLHPLTVSLPSGWWRGKKRDESALNRSEDSQSDRQDKRWREMTSRKIDECTKFHWARYYGRRQHGWV